LINHCAPRLSPVIADTRRPFARSRAATYASEEAPDWLSRGEGM
jgi:hypothetical protein